MAHAEFQAGDLTAVIGDNEEHGGHRAGYNGIWDLRHRSSTRNLFVPAVAGLNHEHIFSGDGQAEESRETFFEPRTAPMTFRKLSDTEAELHQPPTPRFRLESWTRFTLVAPHYIDMHYKCMATQHVFERGYIGIFWASYMNAPLDKSLYFLGGDAEGKQRDLWCQFCTQRHNDESTVLHRDDAVRLEFDDGSPNALYKNFSPFRYDLPFYYGLFEEHTWIVMFDRSEGIRFTHSPSGGGANRERATTNPAWDFQFIIPAYEVMETYEFRVRAAFRPRCGREEIVEEYRRWAKGGGGGG